MFSSSFFLPPSICFFEREIKNEVCMWEWWWRRIREVYRISFFGHDKVRIYTHTLQYQCNFNLNCNEQYKEGIGHDSSKLWDQIAANQSTKSIQLIILILTIWKDIASNYDYITNFSITNKGRKYLSYWAHEKEFIINNKLGSSSFFFLFFFFFFSKIKVWKSLKKILFHLIFYFFLIFLKINLFTRTKLGVDNCPSLLSFC